eukprot:m.343103 g.343103  ORF g.343103 m.343103 type:complete len:87 (+) comp20626_c1_seq2:301-561(+)
MLLGATSWNVESKIPRSRILVYSDWNGKSSPILLLMRGKWRVCRMFHEAKLEEFGVPVDELGFTPMDVSSLGQALGTGPAGLVSAT